MKSRTSSRTGLFLMELILAVLFFSLAGSVCIQLFVKSHAISEDSVELNHSVLWSQNVAEAFYGCDGDAAKMAALFDNCIHEADEDGREHLTLYYGENFLPLTDLSTSTGDEAGYSTNALYSTDVTVSKEKSGLLTCNIIIRKTTEKEELYSLSVSLFPGKEAAGE